MSRRVTPRQPSRRFGLESLESRHLMAYDIDFFGGVFDVEGGSGDDQIAIFYNLNTAESKVVVEVRDMLSGQVVLREDRPIGEVTRIDVHAFGGEYDEIINDTSVPMRAWGGDGMDLIISGAGHDELRGEAGDDALIGNGGNDLLEGGSDHDELNGGPGNDTERGGTGGDWYYFDNTTGGADFIDENGITEDNRILFYSMTHGVQFDLGSTAVQSVGSFASIQLSSALGILSVAGTYYNDTLFGNARDNILDGMPGDDLLFGRAGNDTLSGGYGNDQLHGEAGNDLLGGGQDNDRFVFGPGPQGSDTAQDYFPGSNQGIDTLVFSSFGQAVSVDLTKTIAVQNSLLTLTLKDPANFENIIGSAFGDTLLGNAANNGISGGGGNDLIKGGAGADSLSGQAGADTVFGEAGNDKLFSDAADILFGGLGTDTFDGRTEAWFLPNPNRTRYRDWNTK